MTFRRRTNRIKILNIGSSLEASCCSQQENIFIIFHRLTLTAGDGFSARPHIQRKHHTWDTQRNNHEVQHLAGA